MLLFLLQNFVSIVSAQPWFHTNQTAQIMISGKDFNNTGGPLVFNHPSGLASDGNNLLVCDRFNNRVLIWKTAPKKWDQIPDLVLGQIDFVQNNPGDSKKQLNWPGNVSVAKNGTLAVADTENDRILIWNSFPTANGQAADIAIDLPSLTPPGAMQKYEWPWGVWTDGKKLAAVATQGSALLFWNDIPSIDNQPPSYTIALPQFGTPRNISTDGTSYFFVGDHNAKVNGKPGTFFWNSYPSNSNQNFSFYRSEWVKGTVLSNQALVVSGLNSIYYWNQIPKDSQTNYNFKLSPSYYNNGDGVDVVEANGYLYVCNYNGNTVLVYDHLKLSPNSTPAFALSSYSLQNKTLDTLAYIQNPCLATDGYKLIISSDFDRKFHLYNQFPTVSGQYPDQKISTVSYNFSPWDIACFNNKIYSVGLNQVSIWNSANNIKTPETIYTNSIGSATFNDLKGVAKDSFFFYISDRKGNVFIWEDLPKNSTDNPDFTLNFGNVDLNRLSSNGQYFCVTQQSPPAVYIYKIEDLKNGNSNPWKTIKQAGLLNLPSEAITFNGSLAIANTSFHDILLWKDINQAPDPNSMIVLGQEQNNPNNKAQIGQNKLFMPASLLYFNSHLWVGEHKFSSRILDFKIDEINSNYQYQHENSDLIFSFDSNTNCIQIKSYLINLNKGTINLFSIDGKKINYTILIQEEKNLLLKLNNYNSDISIISYTTDQKIYSQKLFLK